LNGSIPIEIGNLTRLEYLDVNNNQLNGSIPTELENLRNAKILYFLKNPSLSGRFTPVCQAKVYISDTNITLCGCASSINDPAVFPPIGTPRSCVATGPASPLAKRALVFSTNLAESRFTCNTDSDDINVANPYQDCMGAIFNFCNTTHIANNLDRINYCKNTVDSIFSKLSLFWRTYRRECGQWPFQGVRGSGKCTDSTATLKLSAIYIEKDGTTQRLGDGLFRSIQQGLWSNPALKG